MSCLVIKSFFAVKTGSGGPRPVVVPERCRRPFGTARRVRVRPAAFSRRFVNKKSAPR